ncbi:MAG: beta-glucosidase [Janthinobacterium lividum]
MTQPSAAHNSAEALATLTDEEKVELLSGFNMWKTRAILRLGIPSIVMTDGTYGVRYSIDQIDNDKAGGQDLDAFLAVVNQRADHVATAWGQMKPATCFANGSNFGCSWDVELAHELGAALARECQAYNVQLLLGPGINIRRTPLGGRSYEYYAEDPVVSGDIAAGVINGLQSNGVGASLKHFACNNSEVERTTMNSVVDERALREIYLLGFERAIAKSDPWTVMSSYNRLNGVQAAEDPWLLTTVLRQDWGYKGLVVSDWNGIKDRPASLRAGNELDMPENSVRKAALLTAIRSGAVDRESVDQACGRVLALVDRALAGRRSGTAFDQDEHHCLARKTAAESIVLLKNDGVLPLVAENLRRIAVVGAGAVDPVIQGSGCATTTPTRVDVPLDEIRRVAGAGVTVVHLPGTSTEAAEIERLRAEAVAGAATAEVVIVFVSTEVGYDGENSDRRDLALAPGHDALVAALAAACRKVVVVLANPDAVLMPWLGEVEAVVETFFAGQGMGGAVAEILFGHVNPSGKLTSTFPARIEDIPGYLHYPGENGLHLYSEGNLVGYRTYDKRGIAPLFAFGFGLSYTRFTYGNLRLSRDAVQQGQDLVVTFELTNSGAVDGKEICQIYLQHGQPRLRRAPRDLRAFRKVTLAPGQTKTVEIRLEARDFQVYDPAASAWVLDNDAIAVCVGTSSRDIRLSAPLRTDAGFIRHRRVARDTQPAYLIDNPIARRALIAFLQSQAGITADEAERTLEHCRNSFFGIFTTLDRRLRITFDEAAVQAVCAEINRNMAAEETAARPN